MLAFTTNISQTALADLPVFAQARIAQVTSVLVADITSKGSASVYFRNCGAGPVNESTLVDFLAKKGFRRFALISNTTAYGREPRTTSRRRSEGTA